MEEAELWFVAQKNRHSQVVPLKSVTSESDTGKSDTCKSDTCKSDTRKSDTHRMEIWDFKFKPKPNMCFSKAGVAQHAQLSTLVVWPILGQIRHLQIRHFQIRHSKMIGKWIDSGSTALQVTTNNVTDKSAIGGHMFQEALGGPIPGHIGHPGNDSSIFS